MAGSFDIAPMNQYAVVCHIESKRPQKMYNQTRLGYKWSLKSMGTKLGEATSARVYSLAIGKVSVVHLQYAYSACSLLVEVCPYVDNPDEGEEHNPTCGRTYTPTDAGVVKEQTNGDGADDLGEPVHEVVKCTGTNVKQGAVVVIELCT